MRIALGQLRRLDEEDLRFARQLGVTGIQLFPDPAVDDPYWTVERLAAARSACEAHGLVLESVAAHIYPAVMLGTADRDRELEYWLSTIRNMGEAGVPVLGHDFMPNSVWRTSTTHPVRGGAPATAFDAGLLDGLPIPEQRRFSLNPAVYVDEAFALAASREFVADEMWANYEYFLRAALPEAEAAGVMLALHPDDPPMPTLGGIARIFSSVDGFKRAEQLANSPAWGVLACLGSFSEMPGGAANVFEAIRHFGPRGKIAYVHFRDVQGTVPNFVECYLGEGSFNPFDVMALLRDSGFSGFLMDDHVPHTAGDTRWGHRGRAHAIGYMQGLFAALDLPIA